MGRRKGWTGDLSKFGEFLREHQIGREQIATAIGVTPSYISLLAHGKARPGLQTAVAIERWTRETVKAGKGQASAFACSAWYPAEDAAPAAA